jgi:formamidopyrimidine-DNA glycosylase
MADLGPVPELPEVEIVRRGLSPVLEGARIARAEARRADLRFPLPARFAERLAGAKVLSLQRRAKYLIAPLDTGETLVSHLGMSGRFSIVDARVQPGAFYHRSAPDPAHTHVVLQTGAGVRVEYNDPRRFGYMDLVPSDALEAHAWFSGLGPEPLGNAFHADHLAHAFAGRTQSVKATLLDQRVVAGLGNIYVCEALFRSGISPRRAAGKIARVRLEPLVATIRTVLEEAIEAGGSTLRDYAQTDGALGYFQHRFQVYGREGEGCVRCMAPVRRLVQGGRSTFWCARCQR